MALDKIIIDDDHIKYSTVELQIDREKNNANIILNAPTEKPPCPERSVVTIFSPGAARSIDEPAEVNDEALPKRPTDPTEIVS